MATNYYRHKVTVSGEANGHLYYTSTNNGTVQAATTPSDWYDNVYSKDGFVSFPGTFEGTFEGNNIKTTVMKVLCAENPEAGTSISAIIIKDSSESAFMLHSFDSVVTDELVD